MLIYCQTLTIGEIARLWAEEDAAGDEEIRTRRENEVLSILCAAWEAGAFPSSPDHSMFLDEYKRTVVPFSNCHPSDEFAAAEFFKAGTVLRLQQRNVRISREEFEHWSDSKGYRSPQFWRPSTDQLTGAARADNLAPRSDNAAKRGVGRPASAYPNAFKQILSNLQSGALDVTQLENMKQKQLADLVGVSRGVADRARTDAIAAFNAKNSQ